eukprot:TRINITY_DN503_c0_g1_i1.p1 TRINITY_DN503_c0_g1~~TRINITY_DN503_c0_g1_i1.p1  ORF type:complete len:420 (+),score=78.60 TRINITY_DN503_c0_g1_i1:645-1904(+)
MDESDTITTLSCGHGYCIACWKDYLSLKILEKKTAIRCPGINCPYVLDEDIVIQLSGDDKEKEKLEDTLLTSFIELNPMAKWCPAPGCVYGVLLNEVCAQRNENITCNCGHRFCFRCSDEAHQPARCVDAVKWNKINEGGDDSLNEKYISTISKKCPNCNNNIEKNGGCNHMTCRSCGYHFCWQCMGKFGKGPKGDASGYGSHKCNEFHKEDDRLKDKEDWERFQFYSERFNNHHRSSIIEKRLFDSLLETRHEIQNVSGLSWVATQYVHDAIIQLLQTRDVVKYSYAFGYFRPTNDPQLNKNLFEHRQNELERHTEMLSHLLEDKEPEELFQERDDILNISKLVENSRDAFLDVTLNSDKILTVEEEEAKALQRSLEEQADYDLQMAIAMSMDNSFLPQKRKRDMTTNTQTKRKKRKK